MDKFKRNEALEAIIEALKILFCFAVGVSFIIWFYSSYFSESVNAESSVDEISVDDSVSVLPDYENVSFDSFNGNVNRVFIWTDEETGIQYIIYREKSGYAGFGGITPRLNADGTLYVTADSE